MTDEEKKQLFVQLDREIGTLIQMLGDRTTDAHGRAELQRIAAWFDDEATLKLQRLLYPSSLPKESP